MPRVRIEWVPVQMFGLGRLGFDHLQLVFESDGHSQDHWYVMEGVRDAGPHGIFLGIEGADGRTTLATANVAARADLSAKIGTPELRGSRALPYNGEELRAWETMAGFARTIEEEDYPYIAYSLPGSPNPTINSSSAVASLIHYSGLDPNTTLPHGMHFSPGMTTLLGTGSDDIMRAEHGFSTFIGGRGNDTFSGSNTANTIEKFYGGEDDDLFRWSGGFNIIHGGMPALNYAADGTDVIDYSGAGEVTITFNRHWIAHKVPNLTATFAGGTDHLFSIERIQWNHKTDRILPGKGIDLQEDNQILRPAADAEPGATRSAWLIQHDTVADIEGLIGDDNNNRIVGSARGDIIEGRGGDDVIYGGPGNDTLIGGTGSDAYVYLPGDGDDTIIELASANGDIDELILTSGIDPGQVELIAIAERDLLISMPDGSVLIAGFFDGAGAGIERIVFDNAPSWDRSEIVARAAAGFPIATAGSELPTSSLGDIFQLLPGAVDAQPDTNRSFADAFLSPVL
ncbi:Hemolysin-type calcium-binding region [Hyphomicrobium sulfonivorans]|uniref:Hemolysin-type calcium-binding region n=1 Tax=Hyphomicrobium sulfonivorans TaxID=121290 RepID=A0A109BDH8_HYPSL|nr:Hemolysin-type calcium-binding region [Hyphomicrobium sulfonivorans]